MRPFSNATKGLLQVSKKAEQRIKKGRYIMTYDALMYAIENLIEKRRQAHGNDQEQARINAKLTKLYDLKYTMLEQQGRN